ncbi:hypothetical protein EXIGLDRAFT_499672 [Exidia glandulosa HHB12029]|uniref:Uncharacterized protein n=1 Tax=Exidia glandulosa HHB12029 TaxID=1314781 RepID=A0A166N7F2_EXIGL|nr:hypothetical protein EXIGLDRAFT_499672 [Exidia glandulosa HHB12029]
MPALVQRVWSLVAGFWDSETVDAPDAAMEMRVLQQAVHVMHHLALSRGATNELRDRLHAGQGGIDYMFAVAIGRLAYADPPERLAQTLRDELRKLTGAHLVLAFEYYVELLQSLLEIFWNWSWTVQRWMRYITRINGTIQNRTRGKA